MVSQVVIRSVRNAPELAPAEREQELKVRGRLGIEAQFRGIVVAQTYVLVLETYREQPVVAVGTPVIEPFEVRAGLAEEFKLHLLEFAHAEYEVSGGYLVSEGLAYLSDAERDLLSRRPLNVDKVDKDALSRFRTQINGVLRVLGNALERLEHKVELTDIRKVMLATRRAEDVVVLDELLHLRLRERVYRLRKLHAVFREVILYELVRSETLVAFAAVHQRIREAGEVTGRDPRLRVHEDRRVKPYVVF